MATLFFFEKTEKIAQNRQQELKKIINAVIKDFKFIPKDINIVLCNDEFLFEINKKYLNHNYYTDIITFPNISYPNISGDLLISVDRVNENSVKYEVDFHNELARVVIHGILHLCGINDTTKEEKSIMTEMENKYLNIYCKGF